MKRWSIVVALLLVVSALVMGSRGAGPASLDEQSRSLAASIKCPVCSGESVADSQSPVARAMKTEISERLQRGESPKAIKGYFVSRYGQAVVMDPAKTGSSLLVWLLPIAALAVGVLVFLGLLRSWRLPASSSLSSEELRTIERNVRS